MSLITLLNKIFIVVSNYCDLTLRSPGGSLRLVLPVDAHLVFGFVNWGRRVKTNDVSLRHFAGTSLYDDKVTRIMLKPNQIITFSKRKTYTTAVLLSISCNLTC